MDVLKKINKLRIDRGWSVYHLSEAADLAQSTVINMFNRGTLPSLSTLESICRAFGITMSEFFTDDSEDNGEICTKEEFESIYASLTPSKQKIIVELMKAMSDN